MSQGLVRYALLCLFALICDSGRGTGIGISLFLSRVDGVFHTEQITFGEKKDGYWKSANVTQQMVNAAHKIRSLHHPNKTIIFVLDNSNTHFSMPSDSLIASRMGLWPGGKKAYDFREGWFINDQQQRISQTMHISQADLRPSNEFLKLLTTKRRPAL